MSSLGRVILWSAMRTDRFGERRLAGNFRQLHVLPALKIFEHRPGVRLAESHPFFRRFAICLLFAAVERGDAQQRL